MELELGGHAAAIEDTGHEHGQEHEHAGPAGDPSLHTLPVHIVDASHAIRVHQAPYDVGTAKTVPLTTTAVRIAPADRHRGRMVLICTTAFLVGFNLEMDASQDSQTAMGLWPANLPMEIRHRAAVFAAVPTSTGALSVFVDRTSETTPLGVA
jgi:hypothetical protein